MTDTVNSTEPVAKNRRTTKTKSPKSTRPILLRKLLTRKSGATIAQIQKAFGWQPHTARAAISGLRKRGETVQRSDAATGSVYRINAKVAS